MALAQSQHGIPRLGIDRCHKRHTLGPRFELERPSAYANKCPLGVLPRSSLLLSWEWASITSVVRQEVRRDLYIIKPIQRERVSRFVPWGKCLESFLVGLSVLKRLDDQARQDLRGRRVRRPRARELLVYETRLSLLLLDGISDMYRLINSRTHLPQGCPRDYQVENCPACLYQESLSHPLSQF